MEKYKNKKFVHWLHTDGAIGGQERFTIFIHAKMLDWGLDSKLIFTDGSGRIDYVKRVLKRQDIATYEFGFLEALQFIKKNKSDYILHYCNKSIPWVMLSKLIYPHGTHHRYFGHGFGNKKDLWHQFTYSFLDKFFFPTQLTLNKSYQLLPKAKNKKVFQYFGVNIPEHARDFRHYKSSGKTVITSLSRLDPGKGIIETVGAFQSFFNKNPGMKDRLDIRIYGHADPNNAEAITLERNLQNMIQQNNLSEVIHLAGHTDRPFDVLLESDFLIFSSPDEYYGIALLEALAVGVPAISVKKGSFVELNSENYGFFIHLDDHIQFAKDIERILQTSPEQYQKLSQNARSTALEKFDINKTTLEYLKNIIS